ncbi:MAG: class I SAM-dependent methyltransferase [Gemmatimonadetes bacterium]|nr:class I SAM-dependent methyltransferase [Gemmatimonadota bacterium]NNM04361.1 class I SAM-dependent methyltransferase [Gemmatimonadota bacterium]
MFSESTELYDFIYSEFKDFEAEAEQVTLLLRNKCPSARRLLDVGCGTGRHAAALTEIHGFEVDGIDIESGFLEIARGRCPKGRFYRGDMASFNLDTRYDAILCLFSSIGYVRTLDRLTLTARTMRKHVAEGGVAIVEPWFTPDAFLGGNAHVHSVDGEHFKIARVSRSEVRDRISWMEFQYLVGEPSGIQHLREVHELGLFTKDEMMEAFCAGGFDDVEFDPEGLTGRGLYLARTRIPEEG